MITQAAQPRHYMGADRPIEEAEWVLVGMPYDGTCSYRPGTRFAPNAIREASYGLEMYSPDLDLDLEDVPFADYGDLDLPFGNREEILSRIHKAADELLAGGRFWAGLGGEHLVTLPVIEAYIKHYPDLCLVHFDAHADLRHDYLGETLSHATVMRRVSEYLGPDRMVQIGIRSGPRSEFAWMRQHGTLLTDPSQLGDRLRDWAGRPLFVSIDLDVLDPSIFPGTGTPEPGGMTYRELVSWLVHLRGQRLVGFDAVELSPPFDHSGVSQIVAAKVVRECLLLAGTRVQPDNRFLNEQSQMATR